MTHPFFVNDYPASQAALARLRAEPDGTQVAERFELYVDGLELANGFRELGDALEQRRRFEQDLRVRDERDRCAIPSTSGLLAALDAGPARMFRRRARLRPPGDGGASPALARGSDGISGRSGLKTGVRMQIAKTDAGDLLAARGRRIRG